MKVFLVHHIPVTHCCCRFLRPRRRKDAGARLLCVARSVVLASPTTDHPCPGQGILWSRAHGLRAQVRALPAVPWATFRSPPREFPALDCASPPRGRLAFFGKDLFWGCDTVGQGHTGIWHGSLVEQQAACKEAAALHPKGKASRAERRGTGASPPTVFGRESSKLFLLFFLFLLVGFFSPNSSAGGTPSLETGKHPCRLLIQHQQWIYPPGRRRDVSDTAASRMH